MGGGGGGDERLFTNVGVILLLSMNYLVLICNEEPLPLTLLRTAV
jgi:hypothetical protein